VVAVQALERGVLAALRPLVEVRVQLAEDGDQAAHQGQALNGGRRG
jgi:hypothetical protein